MKKAISKPKGVLPKQKTINKGASSAKVKTSLLILGMHRSGTSAFTRVLNLLGYALPDELIGALDGNQTGHWEPKNIVDFNDRILTEMGTSWHDFKRTPSSWLGPNAQQNLKIQTQQLIEQEFKGADNIVLKDPRLCRFSSVYIDALDQLGYRVVPIIIYRNPAEVVDSLQRRDKVWPQGLGESAAAFLWLRHVLDAEFNTRGMARSFCEFSELLKDWQTETLRVSEQTETEFPESFSETAPSIEAFLRPDLRHERKRHRDVTSMAVLNGWCLNAYDALGRLSVDPNSKTAMVSMDAVRSEFDAAETALSHMSRGSSETIRSLSTELVNTRKESEQHSSAEKAAQIKLNDLLKSEQTKTTALEEQAEQIDDLREELEGMSAIRSTLLSAQESEKEKIDLIAEQKIQIKNLAEKLQSTKDKKRRAKQAIRKNVAQIDDLTGMLELRVQEHHNDVEFLSNTLHEKTTKLAWHEGKVSELNDLFTERNLELDALRLSYRQNITAFLDSKSWRMTAPLRACTSMVKNIGFAFGVFRKVSREKGGYVLATGYAMRMLWKQGRSGVRNRLVDHGIEELNASKMPPKDTGLCFIVATEHVMSLAQMMARVLREAGFRVSVSTNMEGAEIAEHLFVICPQMFTDIPDNYIAVQMEQSVNSRWFTPEYFAVLNKARAVIDYSIQNLGFLGERDIPLHKLHYVPIDVDRTIDSQSVNIRNGILFYGDDNCPRRREILAAVREAYPDIRIINNLFQDELNQEIRNAAVVLNIHFYEGALLETTRIFQALSFGTPVVSEESVDQNEHSQIEGIVDFAPIGDIDQIIELLRPYVEDQDHVAARQEKVIAYSNRDENKFEMYFQRFLLSQKMIGFESLVLHAPNYPIPIPDPVQLCLSLPETPQRRAQFLEQEQPGFQVWDGLKATPGWVGAATSYRHMFERIVASGAERATVCEDDVVFPSDFDDRLQVVEEYLDQNDWDIFSGFIADAHEDLQITKVEEFKGQQFVHMDRAVSMVFNMYTRGIMEYLAQWDPTNTDVETNTIDRYLESRDSTQVVLTLPFLVSHRPDTTSTIWGFENTQYDSAVKKSEITLAKKVADFLAE
jgi:hypothetical protein